MSDDRQEGRLGSESVHGRAIALAVSEALTLTHVCARQRAIGPIQIPDVRNSAGV